MSTLTIELNDEMVRLYKAIPERGRLHIRSAVIQEIRNEWERYKDVTVDATDLSDSFGSWAYKGVDGLAYEQSLRSEWGEE